jgi:hypothetical protein
MLRSGETTFDHIITESDEPPLDAAPDEKL